MVFCCSQGLWSSGLAPSGEINGQRPLRAVLLQRILRAGPAQVKPAADVPGTKGQTASHLADEMLFVVEAEVDHRNAEGTEGLDGLGKNDFPGEVGEDYVGAFRCNPLPDTDHEIPVHLRLHGAPPVPARVVERVEPVVAPYRSEFFQGGFKGPLFPVVVVVDGDDRKRTLRFRSGTGKAVLQGQADGGIIGDCKPREANAAS